MRVRYVRTNEGPFKTPFLITDDPAKESNWITVLIGQNGSRKSFLLRLICDAALKRKTYKSNGHTTLKIELIVEGIYPVKVIALSGTPLDRFPRGGSNAYYWYKTGYDKQPYVYFGQRAVNGMVGTNQGLRNLGMTYMKYSYKLVERTEVLKGIFAQLGLSSTLGFRFRRNRDIEKIVGGKREFSIVDFKAKIKSINGKFKNNESTLSKDLLNEPGIEVFAKSLAEGSPIYNTYIEILENLDQTKVEFQLPNGRRNKNELEITLWRYAVILGLVEIEGLRFYKSNQDPVPVKKNSEGITDNDLSSGQWSWLSGLVGLSLELEDNSLILIDEPENSLLNRPGGIRYFLAS